MANGGSIKLKLSNPARVSYFFISATLVLVGLLHMATPLLGALFGYFALTNLHFVKRWGKWPAIILFLILLAGLSYALVHFTRHTVRALPKIADEVVPSVIHWAEHYHITLPFDDYDSLKAAVVDAVKSQANYLASAAKFARGATTQVLYVVVGLVVAIGVFLNPRLERGGAGQPRSPNLYSLCCAGIEERFSAFYRSFATVMGAQIIISAINTIFTAAFVTAVHLPHAWVVIGGTFLCGMLPVVGNLVSNSVVVGLALTRSPGLALTALIFLIVIHKLEYFLNSKIVGDRIQTPLWLTLLGLIIGERLMGVPGMILAPVVLNYLRLEGSKIEVPDSASPQDWQPVDKVAAEVTRL
jgi:predicted PurR-regulated permease PerM